MCAQGYEEAGTDLAQALTQKDKIARTKAAMSPEIAKALARLSSGLYVVTAAHTKARGAMVRPALVIHAPAVPRRMILHDNMSAKDIERVAAARNRWLSCQM